MPEEKRRDFTLYVDEFQTYANAAFATMLSESRKYRLSLVTANQFMGQVPEQLRFAIIGNVGTIIAFRVGSVDAPLLASELGLTDEGLIDVPNLTARVKRISGGVHTEAEFISTLPPTATFGGRFRKLRNHTRNRYAFPSRPGVRGVHASCPIASLPKDRLSRVK